MPQIRWLGDTTGIDLHPTWNIQKIRIHTVKNMLQPDETRRDTLVLALLPNADEMRKLTDEFGKENVPLTMLGSIIIPLFPNAVLWTWNPPKGYEKSIRVATYTAFEIVDEKKKPEVLCHLEDPRAGI